MNIRSLIRAGALLSMLLLCVPDASFGAPSVGFQVSFPRAVETQRVTGRLIVFVAHKDSPEPRLAMGFTGPAMFGMDVENLPPGQTVTLDASAIGYPMEDLGKLPAGDYFVQALLIRYSQVRRSDGHTLWVPLTSQHVVPWLKEGNFHSKVHPAHLDPAAGFTVRLDLTEVTGPVEAPKDSEWIKTVRLRSEVLSRFWGTPIYIGARVLLPKGYDEHSEARYPAIYVFGHGDAPFFFNPDPASHEGELASSRDANLQTGYELYQTWTSDGFPRVVGITPVIQSPYFIESYAVNSVNNGPWGDAITKELIPHLEKQFRLIAKPYARIVEGASTGGWEALALQLYYPDFFGGAWVFNPDPIDFSRYQLSDIYKDENMFTIPYTKWSSVERAFRRTREGQPIWTTRQLARMEAVLGSRGRSNLQLDIWQATHGPVGPDGYPVPLFDKLTGKIDRNVVSYMREHGYDLSEYTRRNWPTLGPKIAGKLNFFAGEQDDFFLNLAVYQYEAMLEEMDNPRATARFEYGRPKKGHNWHLTDFSEMVREMAAHMKKTAPPGENLEQWSY